MGSVTIHIVGWLGYIVTLFFPKMLLKGDWSLWSGASVVVRFWGFIWVAAPLTGVGCLPINFPVKLYWSTQRNCFLSFCSVIKGLTSGLIRNRLPTHNEQIKTGRFESSQQVYNLSYLYPFEPMLETQKPNVLFILSRQWITFTIYQKAKGTMC